MSDFRRIQEAYYLGTEELDVGQALNPKTIKVPEGHIQLPSIGYSIDPEANPMCVYRMSRTAEPYIDLGSKTAIVDFFVKEHPSSSLYALANSDDAKKIDEYLDLAMSTGSGEAEEMSEDLLQKPEEKDVTDVTIEPVKTVAEEEDEELINDETELDEGRMKELHMYIDKGMSAEQIAKKMKLDVKTIKALMPKEEAEKIDEEVIDEILMGGKKLTSKEIVKKIKKNKNKMPTLKPFADIFAKFSPGELHSRDDLEGMLPDYVNGAEITALYAENDSYTKEEVYALCHSKDHDCATIIEHSEFGLGKPLHGRHAIPDEEGFVEWYDVQFKHGIEEKIYAKDVKILASEMHHKKEAKGGKRIANKKMKIKNVGDLKHYIVRNYSITGKDKKDPDELRASDKIMQAPSWNSVKDILKKNMFDKKEMDNLYNDLINYQLENAKEFLGVEEYEMKDENND